MNTFKFTFVFTLIIFAAFQSNAQKIAKKIKYADIELLDGSTLKEDAVKDKVIVINFWGTWCRPCIKEFPTLNKIQKEFADNEDVLFLAITDPRSDNATKINTLLAKKSFGYTQLKPVLKSVFFNLGSKTTLPQTVIYNRAGEKIAAYGELTKADLKDVKSKISEGLGN